MALVDDILAALTQEPGLKGREIAGLCFREPDIPVCWLLFKILGCRVPIREIRLIRGQF